MSHTTDLQPAPSLTSSDNLRQIIARNRAGEAVGTYAVCSGHAAVIEAAIHQSLSDGGLFHVESTSSQVNQFGGYTGMTPRQFADSIRQRASAAGLPTDRVLLGADHLGPYSWRAENADNAMAKACDLARDCVHAGYQKIHLDASMPCAGDGPVMEEKVVAERAAILCQAAEQAWSELPNGSSRPLYVIGTEVPPPGGEVAEGQGPAPTRIDDVHRTIEVFREAFLARKLNAAWENVIALVVQPGVEFGDTQVFDYDRAKAQALTSGLPSHPALVYEAHSTDYQTASNLAALVQDHFAILKVGPWLTFAFREAVFALSEIEHEYLGSRRGVTLSHVREALDAEMLRNPSNWKPYYHGDDNELRFARAYSFSDRCRYYWPQPAIKSEFELLLNNLTHNPPPLALVSQYLPAEYDATRNGELQNNPRAMIEARIRQVLRTYSAACGNRE